MAAAPRGIRTSQRGSRLRYSAVRPGLRFLAANPLRKQLVRRGGAGSDLGCRQKAAVDQVIDLTLCHTKGSGDGPRPDNHAGIVRHNVPNTKKPAIQKDAGRTEI